MNTLFRSLDISRKLALDYLSGNVRKFQFRRRVKNKILTVTVVLVVTITLSSLRVLVCYSPADAYMVGVVLSKPDVKYNLSKLAEMEGVVAVDYSGAYSTYVYGSRYDDRLVVVMSKQGLKYANVKIPANEPVTMFVVKGLDINPKQISDNIEKIRGGRPKRRPSGQMFL